MIVDIELAARLKFRSHQISTDHDQMDQYAIPHLEDPPRTLHLLAHCVRASRTPADRFLTDGQHNPICKPPMPTRSTHFRTRENRVNSPHYSFLLQISPSTGPDNSPR